MTSDDRTEGRNLVVCMDGTANRLKATGNTNVLHLFSMLENSDRQLTFYTPGVGTRGDPAALTKPARLMTKVRGLISGYGMRRDISEAYAFLVHNHRPGDRIFVFGFSRGAFAALGLVGLLQLYGIVRSGSDNMIGEVVRRISRPEPTMREIGTYRFRGAFSRRLRPGKRWHAADVHFLGLWDAVKALKYFRWSTRLKEEALHYDVALAGAERLTKRLSWFPSWPYTKRPRPTGIRTFRHAVSIDDRRIPYDVFGIRPRPGVDFEEVWFAGVHSDVGGVFQEPTDPEPSLGRITLKWMVEAAVASDLHLDPKATKPPYREYCTIRDGDEAAKVHRNMFLWSLVGLRRRIDRRAFRRRFLEQPFWQWFSTPPEETIRVHQSVYDRSGTPPGESPDHMPARAGQNYVVTDPDWKSSRPEGHIGAGQPLEPTPDGEFAKEVDGERTNFAVGMVLWTVIVAALVTLSRGLIAPLDVFFSSGAALGHLQVFLSALLAPVVVLGGWSLEFSGWVMHGLYWFAAVVAALSWIGLLAVLYGSSRSRGTS